MRLCIAFAAATFIVATVHGNPVVDETSELEELLGAVKNYLEKEEEDTKATRATACDQPRIFYSSSSVEAQVNAGTGGYWTDWINVDTVQDYGYGEYEDCSRIHWQQNIDKQCLLGCESPLAVKYALVGSPCTATWADIDNCAGSAIKVTSCGVKCINQDVQNFARGPSCVVDNCPAYGLYTGCSRCPNVKVNFFCAGTKPPTNVCCPYSDGCTKGRSLEHLGETLQEMLDVQERRDVVANILEEVREAIDADEL